MTRVLVLMAAAIPPCFYTLGIVVLGTSAGQSVIPQPWGTRVWLTHLQPGQALPALVTIHQDGTILFSNGNMFGGLPGSTIRATPLSGVWERTGPH